MYLHPNRAYYRGTQQITLRAPFCSSSRMIASTQSSAGLRSSNSATG